MKKNLLLLALVIILTVVPLVISKHAKFEGSDDQGSSAISELNPNYKRWIKPIWEPPSGEIESLLFALQASIGTGLIAYYVGLSKGRKEKNKD